jgi:hypothetical protein
VRHGFEGLKQNAISVYLKGRDLLNEHHIYDVTEFPRQ